MGGFAAEAGVVAAAVVEVFTPGDNTGVDLVAGGEHACSSIRCERCPRGFHHGSTSASTGLPRTLHSLHCQHTVDSITAQRDS